VRQAPCDVFSEVLLRTYLLHDPQVLLREMQEVQGAQVQEVQGAQVQEVQGAQVQEVQVRDLLRSLLQEARLF
jgi:hypothetical protein